MTLKNILNYTLNYKLNALINLITELEAISKQLSRGQGR